MSFAMCGGDPYPLLASGLCAIAEVNGRPFSLWIARWLGQCVYGPERFGVYFGLLSIFCWAFFQLPQLWINYRLKKAEALSVEFIVTLFAGDISNLLGAILTKQSKTQQLNAWYFIMMDVCAISQWYYYTFVYHRRHHIPKSASHASLLLLSSAADTPARRRSTAAGFPSPPSSFGGMVKVQSPAERHHWSEEKRPLLPSTAASSAPAIASSLPLPRTSSSSSGTVVMVNYGTALSASSLPSTPPVSPSMSPLRTPPRSANRPSPLSSPDATPPRATARALALGASLAMMVAVPHATASWASHSPQYSAAVRQLQSLATDASPSDSAVTAYYTGVGVGWFSASLYLCSRVPQLLKNMRRRSTDGLSPLMFTMAVLANITYTLSVLLTGFTRDTILCHLPWLLGSIGTVAFDMVALFQFVHYGSAAASFLELPPVASRAELSPPGSPGLPMEKELSSYDEDIPEEIAEELLHEEELLVSIPRVVLGGHRLRHAYYGRIGLWVNE